MWVDKVIDSTYLFAIFSVRPIVEAR
jgi:hypothetical protein